MEKEEEEEGGGTGKGKTDNRKPIDLQRGYLTTAVTDGLPVIGQDRTK